MNLMLMLAYPFMQRALIAGVLVSLCAALLGVFMLWRIGKLRRRETNEMGDISYDPDTGGG